MKKRKQQTASAAASEAPAATDAADLKALIQCHGAFFDTLIELIPAKFYLPQNDDESDKPKPYFHGLSRAAKASLKRQSKENLKLSRRNRHDPEKIPQSSTLDLLKLSLEAPPPLPEDDGDAPPTENAAEREATLTYEELRQRLRKKIESLRGNRSENDGTSNRMKKKEEGKRKRKRYQEQHGGYVEEETIEYGKVKIGDDDEQKRKKKKMPKVKELQRAKKLEEAKKENPKIAEKEWWKAAENRAMGVKVHDDPKLLRESLKKEKKRKEKSSEKWKERVSSQQKVKEDRQQKRKDNIVGRIQDNKARKIAKREKKLMRPGFEGRKRDYITKD